MKNKQKDVVRPGHKVEFSDDDYTSLDVASYTETTGAAYRPPLTEAEAENYGDIIAMPQQRATCANAKGSKKCKREDKL